MMIKVDNGIKFILKAMDKCAYGDGIELDFSRLGKPTDNIKGESFNGPIREEFLTAHWLLSLNWTMQRAKLRCGSGTITRIVPTQPRAGRRQPVHERDLYKGIKKLADRKDKIEALLC